jgi:hypothetical protein
LLAIVSEETIADETQEFQSIANFTWQLATHAQ